MNGARILAVMVTSVVAAAGPALATSGVAIEGTDSARLLAPAGARIEDYRNAGYQLRRAGDEVLVDVDAGPLDSTARFVPPARAADNAISRLARTLTLDSETRYEAISRILSWTARSIVYDLDRNRPQDAEEVLARRSGYCTGIARLTVELLRAVDIPAREVAGYVVDSGSGSSGGYHRWIEAYLPDRGWVFSDPLRSHHYVPATYLRLASEELQPTRGLDGLLIERRNTLNTVDLHHPGAPGVTARRNSRRQLAATLHVRVEDLAEDGVAELTGGSQRRTRALQGGEATFVGLEPGRYTLRLQLAAGAVIERTVELPDRVRRSISLPSASGRLTEARPRKVLSSGRSLDTATWSHPEGTAERSTVPTGAKQ